MKHTKKYEAGKVTFPGVHLALMLMVLTDQKASFRKVCGSVRVHAEFRVNALSLAAASA